MGSLRSAGSQGVAIANQQIHHGALTRGSKWRQLCFRSLHARRRACWLCPNCTAQVAERNQSGLLDEPNGGFERLTIRTSNYLSIYILVTYYEPSTEPPVEIVHLAQIGRLTHECVIFARSAASGALECKIYTPMNGTQRLLGAK